MSLPSAPPSGPLWPGPTIGTLTLRALRRYPDRIAFAEDSGQLSYGGAAELIGRFQRVLEARGLRRGDRVGLLAGNTAQAWCAGMAVQASGMATSWLHPLGSVDDQLYQLADLGAAACIVDADRFPERTGVLAEKAGDVPVLGLGGGGVAVPDLMAEVEKAGAATACDLAQPDDIGLVNYTGGTTGRPKGVLRRQSGVPWIMSLGTALDFEIPVAGRYLAVAPITHVAGTKVLPVLSLGGTVHLQTGFDPERALATIARERISMSLMVPTMIYALLDHPALDRADLSSLELLLYGAAPMSPTRLAEGIERMGPVFSQLYGQTECYPISVLRRAEHSDATLAGSCGSPVSGVSVALLDPEGNPVPPGEPGEICARGPGVMEGYWRQPELTEATFAHGWLHTGDVARADERGYLTIVDRTKDMIISGGFNVFPREVEDALTSHQAVAMAAVFGVSDEKWGEAVTAAVVLRPGAEVTEEELARHVRERKGAVQTPKSLRFVNTLPTTAVGKIDKKALRATWEN
ncbi:AMP-binding protein [Pseudonocardia eucalypti]|uniref:AMP-binding protein n=1 Tax=Pseudonocardia eucalypti TaxID=648755 RepID=A0ABP9QMQ2_9PSEU|nr:fatty-acyl-CoA synthase [Pseudonocardia eucalypti]